MGSLAGMLAATGREVTGSDQSVYPPMSTQLERWGIRVIQGYRAENLSHHPDLVVVGNAMSRGNPEIEALLESGLPYVSMPEALEIFFLRDKHPLVIAGTHGKTTTTSLAGWTLTAAGREPSVLVGGVAKDFEGGFRLGKGDLFVIEGDEYDTAFFDKEPKFLHYAPRTAILTSVEFDHADIYRDLAHVREAFRRFAALIPPLGLLTVCSDDAEALAVALTGRCRIVRYGLGNNADLRGTILEISQTGTRFSVTSRREPLGEFTIPLPGAHNVRNALGVIAACLDLGIAPDVAREGMARFGGVARRQEIVGEVNGVLVIDDFAHHPTAVRETIEAVRAQHKGRRLWAIFEPRSNTSRRKVHQQAFVEALAHADLAVIAGVDNPEKVPEAQRLSPERVATQLAERGRDARFIERVDDIVADVVSRAKPGDVLLVMSNGAFGGIHGKLLAALAEREQK
jgi:UDP-N-acetylmuramate: L-alanyl-gamma-D-glutamyl-meso-diaminopimelate ligase